MALPLDSCPDIHGFITGSGGPSTEDQTEEVLGMGEMVVPILAGILSALRRVIARRVSLKTQLTRKLNAITLTSATCYLFPVAMWDFITVILCDHIAYDFSNAITMALPLDSCLDIHTGLSVVVEEFFKLVLTSWEIPFKDSPTTEDQTEEVLGMGEKVVPILAGMLSALRRVIARRVSLKSQLKRRLNAITITSATCFLFPVAMWDFITTMLPNRCLLNYDLSHVLAFFAASVGFVFGNLVAGLLNDVEIPERYSLLLEMYFKDSRVLQQLVGGVLAIVLRPREAQCPVVWTIAREIVTCLEISNMKYNHEKDKFIKEEEKGGVGKVALLVLGKLIAVYLLGTFWNEIDNILYINEVLELILLAIKDDSPKDAGGDHPSGSVNNVDFTSRKDPSLNNQRTVGTDIRGGNQKKVLAPENLENMWAKGRNYKKKENRNVKAGAQKSMAKSSVTNTAMNLRKDMPIHSNMMSTKMEEKALVHLTLGLRSRVGGEWENAGNLTLNENKGGIKRSNSTSALKALPDKKKAFTGDCGDPLSQSFTAQNLTCC
uniref:Uncharacterized protein n=1 Tax=Salix viminalis TaxID=40686 RepID=A0A6N2MJ23_SALVM